LHIAHDKILLENEVDDLVASLHTRAARARHEEWAAAQLDELIIVSLLSSGLRNSEFCSLALGDTVLGSHESAFIIRRPASRKRTVSIPRRVSDLVQHYATKVRPRFLPDGVDPSDPTKPLLMSEHRHPFDRTGLYRRVVKILTEAGLGDRANVQLLRHTYGYLAYLRTGGNLLFVQRQLGHAHPATTSMYAKLVNESYSDLAERILPVARQTVAFGRTAAGARRTPQFDCEVD
jgi:integrase/recombinase XerD